MQFPTAIALAALLSGTQALPSVFQSALGNPHEVCWMMCMPFEPQNCPTNGHASNKGVRFLSQQLKEHPVLTEKHSQVMIPAGPAASQKWTVLLKPWLLTPRTFLPPWTTMSQPFA